MSDSGGIVGVERFKSVGKVKEIWHRAQHRIGELIDKVLAEFFYFSKCLLEYKALVDLECKDDSISLILDNYRWLVFTRIIHNFIYGRGYILLYAIYLDREQLFLLQNILQEISHIFFNVISPSHN